MMTITANGKEYKVEFGYNSFCDNDLMDRTAELMTALSEPIANVAGVMKQAQIMFACVRDLLYVGFKKHNAVLNPEEVGDILDAYREEAPEGEDRGILAIYAQITKELTDEGFLGGMLNQMIQTKKAKKK